LKKIKMKKRVGVKKKEKTGKKKASDRGTEVPYPMVPSKKDKDRHMARFLDIFRKLEIIMPFGEALQ